MFRRKLQEDVRLLVVSRTVATVCLLSGPYLCRKISVNVGVPMIIYISCQMKVNNLKFASYKYLNSDRYESDTSYWS